MAYTIDQEDVSRRRAQTLANKDVTHLRLDRIETAVQSDDPLVIAFYLPQFHTMPINDRAWGKGFTEWIGVKRAVPNFEGHNQPRIPGELGYYDLADPLVMDRQADLAKEHGIDAFCYYYYNFSGERVMEMPLERLLETGRPDFPFCLCWANENWTKTWEGSEEVIIEHKNDLATNMVVIDDLLRYIKHPQYLHLNGRPLVLIYRASVMMQSGDVLTHWRERCLLAGVPDPIFAVVESADLAGADKEPACFGADVAVEFPPHNCGPSCGVPEPLLNDNFAGYCWDYNTISSLYSTKRQPHYSRFRAVMTAWDNTARKQDSPAIFINTTPEAYQVWLEVALADVAATEAPGQRAVFINAWNEWGEGTYLEPDDRYGRAFLEATRNAKKGWRRLATDLILKSNIENNRSYYEGNRSVAREHNGVYYLDFFDYVYRELAPRTYFEIGTNTGNSIRRFPCEAVCVDPNFIVTQDVLVGRPVTHFYQSTSDVFFAEYDLKGILNRSVDVAFLDGLHLSEFLLRDFVNTERYTGNQSVILMHDCLPLNSRMAMRDYVVGDPSEGPLYAGWTGDVWKVVVALKKFRPDLSMFYLDCPPTGLVAVTGLNPLSTELSGRYQEVVSYMDSLEFTEAQLSDLWTANPTLYTKDYVDSPGLFKERIFS